MHWPYAVMVGLGLIGAEKNAQEWEAIAVGRYHMAKQRANRLSAPGPANLPGKLLRKEP